MRKLCAVMLAAAPLFGLSGAVQALTYEEEVLADSPLLYYRFEEAGSGAPVADSSGKGHVGRYLGNATPGQTSATAFLGKGVAFDGNDDSIEVNHTITGTDMSIETWFYANAITNWDTIMNHDEWTTGDIHYQFRTNGNLQHTVNGNFGDQEFGYSFAVGEWYHVVVTYDQQTAGVGTGQLRLYVNGQWQETKSNLGGTNVARIAPGNIGAWNGNDREWDGLMDEFAIYDTVLSEERVGAHYAASQLPTYYWDEAQSGDWDQSPDTQWQYADGSYVGPPGNPDDPLYPTADWAAVVSGPDESNVNMVTVDGDHQAVALTVEAYSGLVVDQDESLKVTGPATFEADSGGLTLMPGATLTAAGGKLTEAIFEGTVDEATFTIGTTGDMTADVLEYGPAQPAYTATFVKDGGGRLDVAEGDLANVTVQVDGGILYLEDIDQTLYGSQNAVLSGGKLSVKSSLFGGGGLASAEGALADGTAISGGVATDSTAIPEPSTLAALLSASVAALAASAWRKRRR